MKIQCLILPDTYTTFHKHVLMELIIQKINSKSHILFNATCFWKYNYWEENFWKHSLLIFIARPCDINKMKEVKYKTTPELISDLYLNVWMGEKKQLVCTHCENVVWSIEILCRQTLWNAINIWRMQAKNLGNSHWAVVSNPIADIGLLFKSAKKAGLHSIWKWNSPWSWVSIINTHD